MLWRFQNFATFAGRKNLIPRETGTLWWIGYAIPALLSRLQATREHRINRPKVIKIPRSKWQQLYGEAVKQCSSYDTGICRHRFQGCCYWSSYGHCSSTLIYKSSHEWYIAHSRGITPQNHEEQPEVCLNASPFQDIPASYVKDLQSGEFFNRQSCYLKIL